MAKRTIKVCDKIYLCEECDGMEYSDIMENGAGYPFEPYKIERIIDDKHAYFVDAKNIIWIQWQYEDGISYFSRPCRAFCLDYIKFHDEYCSFEQVMRFVPDWYQERYYERT